VYEAVRNFVARSAASTPTANTSVVDFVIQPLMGDADVLRRRIDRLVHPDLNEGLPPVLTPTAGVSSGFMMAQVTAAAITSECKGLAHPASVDSIPTDGNKEDVVPMAMGAATKLRRLLRNVEQVLAVELMCAAQGIDFRRPLRGSRAVEAAHAEVRSLVPSLTADRVLGPDIERLALAITQGRFATLAH
ncbi:MAG: aromatic amino acid lyase, partial [Gemmatimonadota bacterium]